MRRNTQETVRNKHSFSVIRATIAFYIAIHLDEFLSLLWAFGHTNPFSPITRFVSDG